MEEGNFIVLSSTPSFDPNVGTDNPGVAEHYKVLPNKYKEKMELMWKVGDVSISVWE